MSLIGVQEEELVRRERAAPQTYDYAWIDQIYSDGVTLRFGDGSVWRRHAKVNTAVAFAAGQKVYVRKVGGEYIVICPIGNPQI